MSQQPTDIVNVPLTLTISALHHTLTIVVIALSFLSYRQIIQAKGPAGPNRDYLFNLEKALHEIGEVL